MVTMSGITPWVSKPQKCVPVRPNRLDFVGNTNATSGADVFVGVFQ